MASAERRPLQKRFAEFLEELKDEENEEKYEIFYHEHSEAFKERMAKAEEKIISSGFKLDLKGGETLLETALNKPMVYKHRSGEETIVHLMGTEHNIREAAYDIKKLFDKVNPDIVAIEWDCDSKPDDREPMIQVWEKAGGDLDTIVKTATKAELVQANHFHRDEGFCDKLLEWGTLLSTDMGQAIYLAHKHNKKLFCIDQSEACCDRQIGEVWDLTAMHLSLKLLYGVDCVENGWDIENVYQLNAVCDYYNTALMNQERELGELANPKMHILGTHMRDLFMTKRLQEICEGNPGKTVICCVGACHCPGMRELWEYYIPKAIIDTMMNQNKSKKNLQKVMKKYGGSIIGQMKPIDFEKLQKR